jgi:hypothetical protein
LRWDFVQTHHHQTNHLVVTWEERVCFGGVQGTHPFCFVCLISDAG